MGSSLIVSETGAGQYIATTQYNTARMEAALTIAVENIVKYSADIIKVETELTILEADRQVQIDLLNSTIDGFNVINNGKEYSPAQMTQINQIKSVINEFSKEIAPLDTNVALLKYNLMATRKRMDDLETAHSKYVSNLPIEIWCADYTENVQGEVNTIELSDETNSPNNQLVIIEPQSLSDESKERAKLRKTAIVDTEKEKLAILVAEEDRISILVKDEQARLDAFIGEIPDNELVKIAGLRGELKSANRASGVQHKFIKKIVTEEVTLNTPAISNGSWGIAHYLAALPAFQLYRPRYRAGIIQSIQKAANTCSVLLDFTEVSSRRTQHDRSFNINRDQYIYNVPIEYMDCDALAFAAGKNVVIKFYWSWDDPVVIGFVDNPVVCPLTIFMESTFVDLRSIALCDKQTFLPGIISKYTGAVVEPHIGLAFREGNDFFSIPDEINADKMSLSVGCKDTLPLVTDSCGNDYGGSSIYGEVVVNTAVAIDDTTINIHVGLGSLLSIKAGDAIYIANLAYELASSQTITENETGDVQLVNPITIDIQEGALITTFADREPVYCLPEVIWMKKITQSRIPASMFTGKMKLFIQAVYGSLRTDYNINASYGTLPTAGDFSLFINGVEMVWGFPGTMAIYTTADFEYYLLEIGTTSVDVSKLKLSPAGEDWRLILKDHPNKTDLVFATKVEAFILSTAVINNTNATTLPIAGFEAGISGSPLAYGWKTNRTASQSKIVLHEVDGTDSELQHGTEYTIDLIEAGGNFLLTGTTEITGDWRRNTYFNVWVPDWAKEVQVQQGALSLTTKFTTVCPMYGYYDDFDIYVRYDLDYAVETFPSATAVGVASWPVCGSASGDRIEAGQTLTTSGGTEGPITISDRNIFIHNSSSHILKEFYVPIDSKKSGPATESTQLAAQDYSKALCSGGNVIAHLVDNGWWEPITASPNFQMVDLGGGTGKSAVVYSSIKRSETNSSTGRDDWGFMAIIIPMKDASGINISDKQIETSLTSSNKIENEGASSVTSIAIVDMIFTTQWDSVSEPESGDISMLITWTSAPTGVVSSSSNTNFAAYEANLKAEYPVVVGEETIKQETSSSDITWIDSYDTHADPLGVGLEGRTIITKTSHGGKYTTVHGEDTTNPIDGGYLNDSAIGWI